jgi:predicted amidohydrolase YtcJ
VLNSKALKETGITRETPDTDYGIIDRDINTGEPTGILFGMGGYLNKKIPEVEEEELFCGVKSADKMLLSYGITSFQDVSSRNDYERFSWFERLKRNKIITPRVNVALGVEGFEHYSKSKFSAEVDPNELSLKGVKVVVDETTGKLSPGIIELEELVLSIHTAGWQAIIHAVEEDAIKASISAIEKAVNFYKRSDHRHRIEHCSICPPFLAEKIAFLQIMVVTNPAFIYYSGDRYLKTVPLKQIKYLYPFSSLIKAGICTAAASDAPIATPDPMVGLYAAATRNSETGQTVLNDEKITPFEAFRMFTDIAAKSCFEENFKGSISTAKAGDFAVLSSNPISVSADEIKDIKVEMTIIGGRVVYERGG